MSKYYFLSYDRPSRLEHISGLSKMQYFKEQIVIDKHPLLYLKEAQSLDEVIINFWDEISEEVFLEMKEEQDKFSGLLDIFKQQKRPS